METAGRVGDSEIRRGSKDHFSNLAVIAFFGFFFSEMNLDFQFRQIVNQKRKSDKTICLNRNLNS